MRKFVKFLTCFENTPIGVMNLQLHDYRVSAPSSRIAHYCVSDPHGKGVVKFTLSECDVKENCMLLSNLCSTPMGTGLGTQVLSKVCAAADYSGVTLTLSAMPSAGSLMTRTQLISWYEKFGFYAERGRSLRYREPQRD